MMIDVSTGKPIDSESYLRAKSAAALNGDVFNPTIGYVPIKATGRKYPYNPDYSNFGPRLAAAWNPSFGDGFLLGNLFGNKKSVVRAGWSRAFDRINGVGMCSLRRLESVLVISRFAGHQTLQVYAETAAIPRAISESGLTETTSPSRRCQPSAAGSSFRVWGVRAEERYARRTPTAYSRTATLVLIRRIASEARI